MNNNLKETKRDNLKLKTEKAKAELISLREQLSPHFFFNTLNSLSAVIRTAEKSDSLEFVEKLSQVYRYILDSGNNNLVSINEEIGFLNDYSYLLHKRFGNNFIIDNRINSNVFDYKIPSLALQVLLENVTKHNKLLSSNPIKITIENTDDVIFFRNIMIRKANVESHGSGLKNLNKRYQMICGRAIEIIEKNDEFCVKIPIIK
jgi:LytS/YehU family sensor histidine kinase